MIVSPFNRFKMRQFALVQKLVEVGNLHDAAAALYMSQPAATKLLQEIEEALGAALFVRHPRGMKPTPYGYLAARHGELIFAELQKMQEAVGGLHSGITGNVNIGAIMAAVPEAISPALIAMAQDHPTVAISLQIGTNDGLLREVRAGRLDFAVCSMNEIADVHPLTYLPLSDEVPAVVAGIANPILGRPNLDLKDIHSERWILPAAGTPELRSVEDAFHAAGLPLPLKSIRTASMIATAILVGNTPMLAVVPKSVSRFFFGLQLIGVVDVQLSANSEPYGLVCGACRPLSPAAGALWSLIKKAAGGSATADYTS
jgi:DNA-binding transcriptional LysR family regulator